MSSPFDQNSDTPAKLVVPPMRTFTVALVPDCYDGVFETDESELHYYPEGGPSLGLEAHGCYSSEGTLVFVRFVLTPDGAALLQRTYRIFAQGTWLDATDVSDEFKGNGFLN